MHANTLIAPSILAADFGKLDHDIDMVNSSEADWIHCDVMDGRFVPNISFGFPILKSVAKVATKPLDVHLMIVEPEKYIDGFAALGAEVISVHIEASPHIHRTLSAIRDLGKKYGHTIKSGVAINPGTPISTLSEILHLSDVVCVMSVNPGFGGQSFIEKTYQRVEQLRDMIDREGTGTLIEIDGGVNAITGPKLVSAGADVLVAGSYVFSNDDPKGAIAGLK
ncbi:MAG: ribulose-phosphate 3-epimerase [Bacteroidia bacterium]